jgi:GNAT superfamily N-acetyltransferase
VEGARPARTDDLRRCAELLVAARDAAVGQRGGPHLLAGTPWSSVPGTQPDDPIALALEWASGDPDHLLLAGIFEDAVVGVGAGRVLPEVADGGPRTGIVDCCYVEPAARQVGVGGALVSGLLSWFTGRGCTGVDAPALPGDRSTKQLFESAGLSARLLVLHRRLP